MRLTSGLSGWLCVSALLSGFRTGAALGSIAKCTVSFSGSSTSESVRVAAEAVADASAYVCGGDNVAVVSAEATAEATAKAAAVAVARASAACYSEGKASFKVNGRSLAVAHAYAFAEAFAAGMVEAKVCNKCAVSAEFVADSFSELFLSAVAEAEIKLEGSGSASQSADIFVKAVEEAVVTAFAQVLVDARADAAAKGCDGSIIGVVITGDVADPDGALCLVTVSGSDAGFATSAVASAAIDVKTYFCGADTVKAFATAVAKAIAEVTLDCEIVGNGFACAVGQADASSVAKATARAVAEATIKLLLEDTDCKCEIDLEIIVEAVETIISKAAASAYAEICSDMCFRNTVVYDTGKSFLVQDLQTRIQAKIAVAFASVFAEIRAKNDCSVDIPEIVASVTPVTCKKCVGKSRQCYSGDPKSIAACCDKGYRCMKRSSKSGYCVAPDFKFKTWDGSILTCTA